MENFIFKKESGDLSYGLKRLGRLNSSESEVLTHLYLHRGELVHRDTLLDVGWPKKIVTPNSLNMAIKNIRACFEKVNLDDVITTHVKKGFSWNPFYQVDIQVTPSQAVMSESEPQQLISESIRISQIHDEVEQIEPHLVDDTNNISQQSIQIQSPTGSSEVLGIVKNGTEAIVSSYREIPWLSWFRKAILLFLMVTSLSIVSFYATYWTPISCYEINHARLCGIGEFKKENIPSDLAPGEYVFGYKLPDGEFYYVKI